MQEIVIVNISNKISIARRIIILPILISLFLTTFINSQIKSDESQNKPSKISIPAFTDLLNRPVNLRPELKGVHPRLFFTNADLPKMRERSKGVDKQLWEAVLKDIELTQLKDI